MDSTENQFTMQIQKKKKRLKVKKQIKSTSVQCIKPVQTKSTVQKLVYSTSVQY